MDAGPASPAPARAAAAVAERCGLSGDDRTIGHGYRASFGHLGLRGDSR